MNVVSIAIRNASHIEFQLYHPLDVVNHITCDTEFAQYRHYMCGLKQGFRDRPSCQPPMISLTRAHRKFKT